MTYMVSAPAKLILLGEHLVFRNHNPALGLALPLLLRAHFDVDHDVPPQEQQSRQKANKKTQAAKMELISDSPIDSAFVDWIHRVCERHTIVTPPSNVHIYSEIPIGSGYGSSAALCVALAKGLLKYQLFKPKQPCGLQLQQKSKKLIWYLAHQFEQFLHSPASGLDTALCTYASQKKALLLHPEHQEQMYPQLSPQTLTSRSLQNIYVVSAVVERKITTKECIARVQKKLKHKKQLQLLEHLHHQALSMLRRYFGDFTLSYENKAKPSHKTGQFSFSNFALLIQKLHLVLASMGLCTDEMQEAMQIAKKAGSKAAKLSGAGGGGAFVCFCQNKKDAENVSTALQKHRHSQCVYVRAL